MRQYVIRRVVLNFFVLWIVATIVFFTIRVLPGDYATAQFAQLQLRDASVTLEEIEKAREILGLNKPVLEQYGEYMLDIIQLDFGTSFRSRRSTWAEVGRAMPYTLELGGLILLLGMAIALPVGIISATRQDRWPDYILRSFAVFSLSAPVFWTASIATIFVLKWDLFLIDVGGKPHLWESPLRSLEWYLVPVLAGGVAGTAAVMRLLRSQMLEVLREDYVRTARAKGLNERVTVLRHALPNAMLPVLTVMGVTVSVVFGGQIILEQMFAVPGMGRAVFQSLTVRDYPLFQGLVLITASIVVFTNLGVDLLYGLLDPRVRLGGA